MTSIREAVRDRIKNGWSVWVTGRGEVWARVDDTGSNPVVETEPITPPEGLVLDEILREESTSPVD